MPAMMIAATLRFAPVAAACLLIAACGNEPEAPEPTEDNLDARGEVLGGSISDAMIPLDTLTSQSPSMAVRSEDTGDSDTAQEQQEEAEAEASPAQAAPAVAPAPAPAAEPETPAEPEDPPSGG